MADQINSQNRKPIQTGGVDRVPIDGLLESLQLLLDQIETYELTLPAGDFATRSVLRTLGDMARQVFNEVEDLTALTETASETHPFSKREFQVINLIANGLTNKEMAYRLGISERTVEFHVNSVFNKTGANSRLEAVTISLRNNWISL